MLQRFAALISLPATTCKQRVLSGVFLEGLYKSSGKTMHQEVDHVG